MNKELQELCDFFERLNSRDDRIADEETFPDPIDVSLQDVERFNEFVRLNGGHTGGWDALEHSIFQKLNRKHNLRSVMYLLRLNFPDISEEQIIEHDKWYKKYVALKSNQERALRYWRLKKNEEKHLERDLQSVTAVRISPKTNEDTKLRIQQWKEYKKKNKEEEERKRQQEAEKIAKEKEMKRIVHENKKRMIAEYKKEQQNLKQALKMAENVEESAKQKVNAKNANKMLHLYRKKDVKLIQKMQMKKKFKLQKEHEKERLLQILAAQNRKNVRVSRDPIRLLIPTVEWRQKMKKSNDTEFEPAVNEPLTITSIQHLYVDCDNVNKT